MNHIERDIREQVETLQRAGVVTNGHAPQAAQELMAQIPDRDDPVVNHPQHYNAHPSGIECIEITEHMNFNMGNATKYIWRAGLKSEEPITDIQKAIWYLEREIARLKRGA